VLLSAHRDVRRLKRESSPVIHGYKHWSASWILIDYIQACGMRAGSRVLDLGCGWGLLGIFCAREYGASVTAVDKDSAVFPFLELHASLNRVKITTRRCDFVDIRQKDLEDFDVVLGSDICFWDNLVKPIRLLIRRAVRAGVRAVLISDPGRETFEELARTFVKQGSGEVFDWTARRPHPLLGRILRIKPALL
jgi:predicted nicotinamide N-methyase